MSAPPWTAATPPAPIRIDLAADAPAPRTPYFCSGCPHNISTRADDDQLVGLGIGCHIMAALDDEGRGHKVGMTQMGGEGAQWIGMSPFTDDTHYAQNLGDGTFFHSGSLAVRAAVAAGVDHDLQDPLQRRRRHDGRTDPDRPGGRPRAHALAGHGGRDEGHHHDARSRRARRTPTSTRSPPSSTGTRSTRGAARAGRTPGVTALIHHDPCAAEERRLRNRGQRPALTESVWINSRVCEGCGDCAEQATCMSLVHVDTEFGTKMSVHQGSCNLDMTCVKGSARPSSSPATAPGPPGARRRARRPRPPCPIPTRRALVGHRRSSACPGSGGPAWSPPRGSSQMAAHLAGLHAAGHRPDRVGAEGRPRHLRRTDLRRHRSPGDVHASPGGADLLLGFDLLGAAGDDALSVASPERTVAVVNVAEVPTAAMLRHQGTAYPLSAGLRARIARATRADEMVCLDAQSIAEQLTGDHLAANLVLVGAAFQAGLLPFGADALAGRYASTASTCRPAWPPSPGGAPRWPRPRSSPTPSPGPMEHPPDPAGARRCRPSLEPEADWPEATAPGWSASGWPSSSISRTRGWPVRYLRRVADVGRTERSATGDPQFPVTESFARGLYALTAVKDEYEVARLHLLDEEQEAFAARLPGCPPRLPAQAAAAGAASACSTRSNWSARARPAFRLLRSGRHLRDTPFDPFGWSAERRGERRFRDDYLAWVAIALAHLTPATTDAVRAVVDLANDVHGYAHVRQASIVTVHAEAAGSSPRSPAPSNRRRPDHRCELGPPRPFVRPRARADQPELRHRPQKGRLTRGCRIRYGSLMPVGVLPSRPLASRVLRRALRVADAVATPYGVDRYVELVRPSWSSTEVRAKVMAVARTTPRSVTVTLRPNGNWTGFSAGQYTQLSRRDRRGAPHPLLLHGQLPPRPGTA